LLTTSALTGIVFVLKSDIPWEMLPREMGCGSGSTCWLARYRRLSVRYERRDDIHEAFLHLGCSLIWLNHWK
jgi:transposase